VTVGGAVMQISGVARRDQVIRKTGGQPQTWTEERDALDFDDGSDVAATSCQVRLLKGGSSHARKCGCISGNMLNVTVHRREA
jgi:hypothetical protein